MKKTKIIRAVLLIVAIGILLEGGKKGAFAALTSTETAGIKSAGSHSACITYCNTTSDIGTCYGECTKLYNVDSQIKTEYPNNKTPAAPTCSGETIGGICFPTDTGLSDKPITDILSSLFSWIMGLFSALCVMAFVISGIQYLTAAGDIELIKKAKNNAQWSIVGVLVGLSGFVIVKAIAAALQASPLI